MPSASARRFGITSKLTPDLTLALGSSDLSLLELTSAYGALANQGTWIPPTTIRYVTDVNGKLLEEHVPEGREAATPETAYVVTHMLRGVVERGTGQAERVRPPVADPDQRDLAHQVVAEHRVAVHLAGPALRTVVLQRSHEVDAQGVTEVGGTRAERGTAGPGLVVVPVCRQHRQGHHQARLDTVGVERVQG